MKRVYIDMDDTLCQFYEEMVARRRAVKNQASPEAKWPQGKVGFFLDLKPHLNAIESTLLLNEHYDVWFLTAPSIKNAHSYTEKRLWIEKYFGEEMCHKLIISPNKGLLKGDYLIDDIVRGKGQEDFEGELVQFGSEKYPTWESVLNKFGLSLFEDTSDYKV